MCQYSLQDCSRHTLSPGCDFYTGCLPQELLWSPPQFAQAWALHPDDYHTIEMHGRSVQTPRWQQAYEHDYHYTRRVNKALPLPEIFRPLLGWAQEHIDPRLNGVLLNWYEGSLGHYIGPHHDSVVGLVKDSPIVTISLGEERTFRLTAGKQTQADHARLDFQAPHGAVFVTPYATNLAWKHQVPKRKAHVGQRISVTLRAFATA